MDTDALSTICSSQRVSGRGAGEELQRDLREELLRRERKCESGSGVLPVARSATLNPGRRARLTMPLPPCLHPVNRSVRRLLTS